MTSGFTIAFEEEEAASSLLELHDGHFIVELLGSVGSFLV